MILLYKHYRRLQFLLAGMQFYALGLQNCLRLYRLYSGFIAFLFLKVNKFIKEKLQ